MAVHHHLSLSLFFFAREGGGAPCSVLSSNLNFLRLGLSSLPELRQFTLCLSIPSCLMRRSVTSSPRASFPVRLLKRLRDESHEARSLRRIRGKPTFFFLPPPSPSTSPPPTSPKHPPLYLMSAHAFHFISDKRRGRVFPLLTS